MTKRIVDDALPGVTMWDTELKGFGLRVTDHSRTFILKYSRANQQRWMKIGRFGVLTVDEARARARVLLGRVAAGEDPALEKRRAMESPTVAAFSEKYLALHSRVHKKKSSAEEDARNLKNHILPALGTMKIREVNGGDVARFLHSLRDRPIASNRNRALLSHMFTKSMAWGDRPAELPNPVAGTEKMKENRRERFLSADEFSRLGAAIKAFEDEGGSLFLAAAFRLLVLTGCRKSEILSLKWHEVDFDQCMLRLDDSKTGPKGVPLAAPALEILSGLPRLANNPHVFPSMRTGNGPIVLVARAWSNICGRAGLGRLRIHDLRHSFASVGAMAGLGLPIVGKILGHADAATTQKYAHVAHDPALAAANAIAGRIDAAMKGASGEIVQLRRDTR